MVELGSCDKDRVAHQPRIIYCLALCRKSLMTLGLEERIFAFLLRVTSWVRSSQFTSAVEPSKGSRMPAVDNWALGVSGNSPLSTEGPFIHLLGHCGTVVISRWFWKGSRKCLHTICSCLLWWIVFSHFLKIFNNLHVNCMLVPSLKWQWYYSR